jgi:hypothetical protein
MFNSHSCLVVTVEMAKILNPYNNFNLNHFWFFLFLGMAYFRFSNMKAFRNVRQPNLCVIGRILALNFQITYESNELSFTTLRCRQLTLPSLKKWFNFVILSKNTFWCIMK